MPLERIVSLSRFDRAFDKLPKDVKKRFEKQLDFFIQDPSTRPSKPSVLRVPYMLQG